MSTKDIPLSVINSKKGDLESGSTPDEEEGGLEENPSSADKDSMTSRKRYKEPLTHILNKSIIDKILGTCCGQAYKTTLTNDELISFYKLSDQANVSIDPKSDEYDHLIRQLWDAFSEGETLPSLANEKWKKFGFQGQNPKTDFRATGLLGLTQLLGFVKSNRKRALMMCQDQYDFCFAICSINVTYFLIKYYHLLEGLKYERDHSHLCSRIALKTFCQLLDLDDDLLDKLHGLLLNDLFEIWVEIRKRVRGVTLMDFKMAEDTLKNKFLRTTQYYFFTSYDHLRREYNGKHVSFPTVRPSLAYRK